MVIKSINPSTFDKKEYSRLSLKMYLKIKIRMISCSIGATLSICVIIKIFDINPIINDVYMISFVWCFNLYRKVQSVKIINAEKSIAEKINDSA